MSRDRVLLKVDEEDRSPKLNIPREDLELKLFVMLSQAEWHDITGSPGTDPTASKTFATGFATPSSSMFVLSQHPGEGDMYRISLLEGGLFSEGSLTRDQYKIEWLWEHVIKDLDDV